MSLSISSFRDLPQDNPYQSGCNCLLVMRNFSISATKEAFLYNSSSAEIDFYQTMISLLIPDAVQEDKTKNETQAEKQSPNQPDKFSQLLPETEIELYHYAVYGSLYTSQESEAWHRAIANRTFRDDTAKRCNNRVRKLLTRCAQKMYDMITARDICQANPCRLEPSTVFSFRKLADTLDALMKQEVITAKYRDDKLVTATAYLQYML